MEANRRKLLALSGAVLAACAGCLSRAGDDPGVPSPGLAIGTDVDEADVDALVEGNTIFALEFLDELVAEAPEANHAVSPFSISVAVAMTWAGAVGETETEMADALHFPHGQDELHPAMGALLEAFHQRVEDADDSALDLAIANRIWPDEGVEIGEAFVETVEENYAAEPERLDFQDDPDGSREEINAWVAEQTNDLIDELLPAGSIDARTRLVLTNAIYLLADWLHPFDPDDTTDEPFTGLDGSSEDVPMMSQREDFPYAAVDGHQLVELPYAGEELSMVVLLPAEGEFEAFETDLDADRLVSLLDQLEETDLQLSMPRFEIEGEYELLSLLHDRMGMPIDGFDGIAPGLFIDGIYHDAIVTVDEEGTEAAAATGVVMMESAPPSMTVDRSFLFLIRDRPTGSILFLGRVVEPPEEP